MASKKRGKSPSKGESDSKWETGLNLLKFEEETWKASIALVVAAHVDDNSHIGYLIEGMEADTRRLFSFITKKKLLAMIKEYSGKSAGGGKGGKGKGGADTSGLLSYAHVCDAAKSFLDFGEEIPASLIAKLIKFKLMLIKNADIDRREREASPKKDGKKGGKGDKKRDKSPPKKDKGKKDGKQGVIEDGPPPKTGTKLKRRGEEDDDRFIDDEPDDGPQHYIIITGFHHPYLISLLAETGVFIDTIIQIVSEDYSVFQPSSEEILPEEASEKEKILFMEKKDARRKEEVELKEFWDDVVDVMRKAPDGSPLHDVSRLEFTVSNSIIPTNLDNAESKAEFCSNLYEFVACLLYDLVDAKRQYRNYLKNIDLQSIPVDDTVNENLDETRRVDMRYYNELLDSVENHAVTVPLIMHSMLEQVVATEEDLEPPAEMDPQKETEKLSQHLAESLEKFALELSVDEKQKEELISDLNSRGINPLNEKTLRKSNERKSPFSLLLSQKSLPSYVKNNDVLIINAADEITKKCTPRVTKVNGIVRDIQPRPIFNMKDIELEQLNRYFIFYLLENNYWNRFYLPPKRAAKVHQFICFCIKDTMMNLMEADYVLKLLLLEWIDLSKSDEYGFIESGSCAEPEFWDDPDVLFEELKSNQEQDKKLETSKTTNINESAQKVKEGSTRNLEPPKPKTSNPEEQKLSRERSGILKSKGSSAKSRGSSGATSAMSVRFDESVIGDTEEILNGFLTEGGTLVPVTEMENLLPMSVEEIIKQAEQMQQRNLSPWRFIEKFDESVFKQVLVKATEILPCIDCYHRRQDNSIIMVLHRPYNSQMFNFGEWQIQLHSNVGFRNFLEHVFTSIVDWIRDEEAKYEAEKVALEVEQIAKEEELKRAASASPDKKPRKRSASPKKGSPDSPRKSSPEPYKPLLTDGYVHPNSLKAWKAEQERLKAEEEEKQRKQQERIKSGSPRKKRDSPTKEKNKSRSPSPRTKSPPGGKKKSKKGEAKASDKEITESVPAEDKEEKFWPFHGYDMGNQLIHVSGITSMLFPQDGGIICTERTEYTQGKVQIKVSITKDDHHFVVHIINPRLPSEYQRLVEKYKADLAKYQEWLAEKSSVAADDKLKDSSEVVETVNSHATTHVEGNNEKEQKKDTILEPKFPSTAHFASFYAQFSDGIYVSLSAYGDEGFSEDGKPREPKPYIPVPMIPQAQLLKDQVAGSTGRDTKSPSKSRKGKKGRSSASPDKNVTTANADGNISPDSSKMIVTDLERKSESEWQPPSFQKVNISTPNGLKISFGLEGNLNSKIDKKVGNRLYVEQTYVCTKDNLGKTDEKKFSSSKVFNTTGSIKNRVMLANGVVIDQLDDSEIKTRVLYADGSVAVFLRIDEKLELILSEVPLETPVSKIVDDDVKSTLSRGQKSRAEGEVLETLNMKNQPKYCWIKTNPNGERFIYRPEDGYVTSLEPILMYERVAYITGDRVIVRDDGVKITIFADGRRIVEHADRTIIRSSTSKESAATGNSQPRTPMKKSGADVNYTRICIGHPNFVTTVFENILTEDPIAMVKFGTGTIFRVHSDSTYTIRLHDGGNLTINSEGGVQFSGRQDKYLEFLSTEQSTVYNIRHNADIVCETLDNYGNMFSVSYDGKTSVIAAENKKPMKKLNGLMEEDQEEENMVDLIESSFSHHVPRYFILNSNGSGVEILRYQDIARYLEEAENDPNSVIIKEPIGDFPGISALTILRPKVFSKTPRWINDATKIEISTELAPRDLANFPSDIKHLKTDLPENLRTYPSKIGFGVAIGGVETSQNQPKKNQSRLSTFDYLEIRQLFQYKQLTDSTRNLLFNRLTEYLKYLDTAEKEKQSRKMLDSRTPQEIVEAANMNKKLEMVLQSHLDRSAIDDSFKKATKPVAKKEKEKAKSTLTAAHKEWLDYEKKQQNDLKAMIRYRNFPKYFDSELGKSFQRIVAQKEAIAAQVLTAVKSPSSKSESEATYTIIDNLSPQTTSTPKQLKKQELPENVESHNTSASKDAEDQATKSQVHFSENTIFSPENKAIIDNKGGRSPPPISQEQFQQSNVSVDSLENEHQREEVNTNDILATGISNQSGQYSYYLDKMPTYLYAGKPGELPNERYLRVEDPVRRKTLNSSILTAEYTGSKENMANMRGLLCLPDFVDFGILKEGNTYSFPVQLKNSGLDSCRFKIKQPPLATGLRIDFRPGPIAAGMTKTIRIDLYAMAVTSFPDDYDNGSKSKREPMIENDGIGGIEHNLEITTESQHLSLPIIATILTEEAFDRIPQTQDSDNWRPPQVKLVNTAENPPSYVRDLLRTKKNINAHYLDNNKDDKAKGIINNV